MIEDKKLGLVMAENDEEVIWYKAAEEIKQSIKILKARNENAKKDLKLSAREIEQKFKKGAKASIKQNKQSITIQKEFLKLAEGKIKRNI